MLIVAVRRCSALRHVWVVDAEGFSTLRATRFVVVGGYSDLSAGRVANVGGLSTLSATRFFVNIVGGCNALRAGWVAILALYEF